MVTALATDQALAMTFTAIPMVGKRHLQRRVDCLGARPCKEDVIESLRCDRHQLIGVVKGERMAEREARCVVELACLMANCLGDLGMTMPGIDTPEASDGIEQGPALGRLVVHAPGFDKELRGRLEAPVRSHWHPVGFKVVRWNLEVCLGHQFCSVLVLVAGDG